MASVFFSRRIALSVEFLARSNISKQSALSIFVYSILSRFDILTHRTERTLLCKNSDGMHVSLCRLLVVFLCYMQYIHKYAYLLISVLVCNICKEHIVKYVLVCNICKEHIAP